MSSWLGDPEGVNLPKHRPHMANMAERRATAREGTLDGLLRERAPGAVPPPWHHEGSDKLRADPAGGYAGGGSGHSHVGGSQCFPWGRQGGAGVAHSGKLEQVYGFL